MAQNNNNNKKKKIGDEILFALYSSFTVFFNFLLFFITFYALSYKIFMIP